MKLIIQQRSETPIYEQLYSQIVSQILSGQIMGGEQLPSIRFVARELEISVIPIKSCYEMLEKDGYIYTVQGKGCFVRNLGDELRLKSQQIVADKIAVLKDTASTLGLTQSEMSALVDKYLK